MTRKRELLSCNTIDQCKWEKSYNDYYHLEPYYNTACGTELRVYYDVNDDFKYCPYCGREIGYD